MDDGRAAHPARARRAAVGRVVLAFLHRRRPGGVLAGLTRHPCRAASRGAELGVGRADARHGGRLRYRLVFLHRQPAGAIRALQALPRRLPLPAQRLVFRRAVRCDLRPAGEVARPLPVEDRRRHGDRRHRTRRRRGARHRHHQPRGQASIGLHLSLRLRHADRRRIADHLFHLRWRGAQAVSYAWPILSTVTFLPLFGALLIAILGGEDESTFRNGRFIALWTTLVTFGLSLILWRDFDQTTAQFQFVELKPWLGPISYHMGIDGISMPFVLLTTFLMPLCILSSWIAITARVKEYMIAFLVLETLMIGVLTSLDLVLFYLFFEGGLIPMFLIIGIWGGPRRVYASFKFFLYTLAGSLLMLLAIMAIYWEAGTTDIPTLLAYTFPPEMQTWVWFAFLASFAVKLRMWPVHTWLPDAHVEAPTAGSVILAGILLKMGGYGFLRFSIPMFPLASASFAPLIFALSVIAIIYTSLVALAQEDMKKLIAYSSVAHMGFVT